jgi:hypothetical protein
MHRLVLGALAATLMAGSAAAQTDGRVAVGVQAGSTGLGGEVQFRVLPILTLRAGGDMFSYEDEFDGGRFQYDGEAEFSTVSAMADVHPFDNAFMVSAGAYFGERTVEVAARPSGFETIGGVTLTPAQFGSLVGDADFGSMAPFVGVGFNNTFRTRGRIGFKAVLGATFGEDPSVELRRDGGTALAPNVQAAFDVEREREERELEQDLEDFKILPVAQVGLSFRF